MRDRAREDEEESIVLVPCLADNDGWGWRFWIEWGGVMSVAVIEFGAGKEMEVTMWLVGCCSLVRRYFVQVRVRGRVGSGERDASPSSVMMART